MQLYPQGKIKKENPLPIHEVEQFTLLLSLDVIAIKETGSGIILVQMST